MIEPFVFVGKPAVMAPLYAVVGIDSYLVRQVLHHLRTLVPSSDGWIVYDGFDRKASWGEIGHLLDSDSLFIDKRVIVVEDADKFVTESRRDLETYLQKPSSDSTLAVCVTQWDATTKLAKIVPAINCQGLPSDQLPRWIAWLAREQYGKGIGSQTAQLLVERGGTDMGMLEQEVAKLASYIGTDSTISIEAVQMLVSDRMHEQVWAILDAATKGQTAKALDALADQFADLDGDSSRRKGKAVETLGALGVQLRRLVTAVRLVQVRGMSLLEAIKTAGINPYFASKSEQQIRWIGLDRINDVYPWLMEASLALRESDASEKTILEKLVVRIAQPRVKKKAPMVTGA